MKRHKDQLDEDRWMDDFLKDRRVERIDAPVYSAYSKIPGEFVFTVGVMDQQGRKAAYAGCVTPFELDALRIGPQDSHRELLSDCKRQELAVRERRMAFCEQLGKSIAASLFDHLQKSDPQFGYTREQWDEMTKRT